MAVPWTGIPLRKVIERCQPLSSAKFVRFVSFDRPHQAKGQRLQAWYPWPYYEGLRIAEAVHELTLLATGIFGHALPRQHGAPVRLVVPWKYGFKSIKSIVRISFVDRQPKTSWSHQTPNEYGFYSNVNPDVDHPRWSQGRERRLPGLFATRRTEIFNGYGDEVASMYAGMDLKKNY